MSKFTSHNVRLDDGTLTGPENRPIMDADEVFVASKNVLNVVFSGNVRGKSILDVGCLEGGYATEFARLGMRARGLEIRDSNLANCYHIKSRVENVDLDFIKDDAMNVASHGLFDALFVCGLLYHLDRPRAFLTSAASITKKVLILETHTAPRGNDSALGVFTLSRPETNEGLRGRWFYEHETVSVDKLDQMKWSSWSNNRSFWVEKFDIVELLRGLGFSVIFEQFVSSGNIADEYNDGRRARTSRVMLVAVRP